MSKEYFVLKDINLYTDYIFEVRNLSANTASSYKRDLIKLATFLESLKISSYSNISDETCTGWIGSLYASNNNP